MARKILNEWRQWKVYWVDWTHLDQDGGSKSRPAVLLTTAEQADQGTPLLFLKVTSSVDALGYHVTVARGSEEYVGTGFTGTSHIHCRFPQIVDRLDVDRAVGQLHQKTIERIVGQFGRNR